MIFDIVGWIGMILVLIAYSLLTANKIGNGKAYHMLNLLAAILLAIGIFPKDAWFSFALQIVWALVAIVALIKMFGKKEDKI